MSTAFLIGTVLLVALAALYLLRRGIASRDQSVAGENPYVGLRTQALSLSAAEAGLTVADDQVWGAVMDLPISQAIATVVAFSDGTASIYLSSGGGFVGGGQQPAVNKAAIEFVTTAQDAGASFAPAADFPLPGTGEVRFCIRRAAGVSTALASEEKLLTGRHALSALYAAGQNVISAYREIDN